MKKLDDLTVKEKLTKTAFSAKKSLEDRGLSASIIVDDTNQTTPFFVRNNNWAQREREFTGRLAQTNFVPDGSAILELKGEKLSADNVKVITIHRDNQDNYGFNGLRANYDKQGACKHWKKDVDKWRKANGLKPMYEKEAKND